MELDVIAVLRAFGIENPVRVEGIVSGLINETYKIETASEHLILQRINKEVFTEASQLMENIQSVQNTLVNVDDYQVPELRKTINGALFHVDLDGYAWRMMGYISDSVTYDQTKDVGVAVEAGKLIGKFHLATSIIEPDRLHVILPNFHNLSFRADLFLGALQNASAEKLANASESIVFVEETLPHFDGLVGLSLPLRVTHNDTKLSNLLFDKTSGKGLCLIDLDTLMPGYLYHDFGDVIRTLCNSVTENGKDLDAVYFDMSLFEHFTEGYMSKMGEVLTDNEWVSLSTSIEFMPFIMGLRFLTDYLYGNVYYKTDYSDQNLDRCKNQFALIEKMKLQREKVAEVIRSYK
ncbi:MAG: aminoglycoside phosphotransferase family protein [Cyclobacteriaceae bacterium]